MHRREVLKFSALFMASTASASVSRALLAGVTTRRGVAAGVFDESEQASINVLSDMIIPPTDTPGAVAAGVPDFIAIIVDEWYTTTEREIFFSGMASLDHFCLEQDKSRFYKASETTRIDALKEQERIAAEYVSPAQNSLVANPPVDEHSPFFRKLRELVVVGYYTSEIGSTQELAYRPVPGEYNGDYEYAKVGRQWSQ
jgi:hypothetical protein